MLGIVGLCQGREPRWVGYNINIIIIIIIIRTRQSFVFIITLVRFGRESFFETIRMIVVSVSPILISIAIGIMWWWC